MKGQRRRTHISAHEGSTGGMPACHSIYHFKATAHPIKQCSLYALPSKSVRNVGSRAGVLHITEGREDLQKLEVRLRCKGEKMKLEAIQSKSWQGGPAVYLICFWLRVKEATQPADLNLFFRLSSYPDREGEVEVIFSIIPFELAISEYPA